jgi:hypothetical protein
MAIDWTHDAEIAVQKVINRYGGPVPAPGADESVNIQERRECKQKCLLIEDTPARNLFRLCGSGKARGRSDR